MHPVTEEMSALGLILSYFPKSEVSTGAETLVYFRLERGRGQAPLTTRVSPCCSPVSVSLAPTCGQGPTQHGSLLVILRGPVGGHHGGQQGHQASPQAGQHRPPAPGLQLAKSHLSVLFQFRRGLTTRLLRSSGSFLRWYSSRLHASSSSFPQQRLFMYIR